jgi:methyl-accepting chemotaxis protein
VTFFNRIKIGTKLPALVVGTALLAILGVGIASYLRAAADLEIAAEEKLVAVATARQDTLDQYLRAIAEDVTILAATPATAAALGEFRTGFANLGIGGQDAGSTLQRLYIDQNPHPIGSRQSLDQATDGSAYSASHARLHPWLRHYVETRSYYDLFLIDADGNVVYTDFKEADFATNLLSGPWKDSGLAQMFNAIKQANKPGEIGFVDFAPYAPSNGIAASFIGAPIFENGAFRGVVAFQMPIGRINAVMQATTGMGDSGETYLVGADMLMRSDSRFSEESTLLKTKVETPTVRSALAGETGAAEIEDYRGTPVVSVFQPYDFHGVRWAVIAEIDQAEIMAPVLTMRNIMVMIGLAIMAVLGAAGYFFGRGIARPISAMTGAMQTLAGGDKTVAIPATDRGDEIGSMAQAVQVFKDAMIKADEMAAAQERERAAKEARAKRIEEETRTFDKAVSGILETVSAASTELDSTASSMSATAEETSRQATAVAAASEQASTNVQTVASAAEELASSITEISRQVSQSTEIAGKAMAEATRTNTTVKSLAEAAQKIGAVVNLINEIASQTNLLALNATIEAARAGEAGKGFAVVASEVKSLANQTAKATEEIGSQIGAMQSVTGEAVTAIEGIGTVITQINEIATTIASAVEEQGAATQEIARNVQQASAGTRDVSANISGVTQASGETGAAANQVLAASGELSKQADALKRQVESFLGQVRAA